MAAKSSTLPMWCNVRWTAVRVGGRDGKVAGHIWRTEQGYAFAYLPEYMGDSDSREIDPFNLPFAPVVYEAASFGEAPLSVFGYCLPDARSPNAIETRNNPFTDARTRDLVQAIFAANMLGAASPVDRLPKPADELTFLVWCSHHGSPSLGANGLWFDPLVQREGKYEWLPELVRSFPEIAEWERARRIAVRKKYPVDHKTLGAWHALIAGAKIEPQFLAVMDSVAALPGRHIKLSMPLNDAPGLMYTENAPEDVRPLRLRAAYLELARRCGLWTVNSHLRQMNGRDYLFTEFHRRALCPTRTPPPNARAHTQQSNRGDWNDEVSGTDKTRALLGRAPWHVYALAARALRQRGIPFDVAEAFRRICFSILCGTLHMDASPVLLRYDAEASWQGYFARPDGLWRPAPITGLKPWMIPWKTALAIRPRLVVQCVRYGKMLGLSTLMIDMNLTMVITGIKDWQSYAGALGLNGYESNGVRPAIMVPPAKSGQAVKLNAPVRKPEFPTSIPADVFATPRREDKRNDDDGAPPPPRPVTAGGRER